MKADITLTSAWTTPIGTKDKPFKGHFEGWGHKITNLYITGSSDYAGLFGYIDGGSVRDLGVEGTISGDSLVGGICGEFKSGKINSCYTKVTLNGTQYVGGICGKSTGVIQNCWHEGNITASKPKEVCAGGLVGEASGTLQRCYVKNTVITVPDVSSPATNSYFGMIAGKWDGDTYTDPLDGCVYNTDNVSVANFSQGKDVIVGSGKDDSSPALKGTVKGGSTLEMQCQKSTFGEEEEGYYDYTYFWTGILNDYDEEVSKNNIVWKIVDGSYPELYSFIKNEDITFNFTSTKTWLTIVPNGNYQVPSGMTAYKVASVTGTTAEGGDAILTPVTTLNEGCGALVYSESGSSITANARPVGGLADYSGNLLKGSPTSPDEIGGGSTYATSTDYILYNGEFGRVIAGTIARGKAYLHLPFSISASKLRFVFADDLTAIESIYDGQSSVSVWYTLDGRRLTGVPTKQGVYICNGKKIYIQ